MCQHSSTSFQVFMNCKTHSSWLLAWWDYSSLTQAGALYTVVSENQCHSVATRAAFPGVIYCSQAVGVSRDTAGTCGFTQKAAVVARTFSIVIVTQLGPQLENQAWEDF